MISIRYARERGHTQLPWLDSRHSFSFGDYYDEQQMGYRALRVINDDHVDGKQGFGMHPHRDMEILSFVYEGVLEHIDDLGNRGRVEAGEVQKISAGTGIRHAERNPTDQDVHFLQVWIEPERKGIEPSYEKAVFAPGSCHNCLQLVASPDGHEGGVHLNQDANIYSGTLDAGQAMELTPGAGRHLWIQLVKGSAALGDETLTAGDGAALSDETSVWLSAQQNSTFLVFDLA